MTPAAATQTIAEALACQQQLAEVSDSASLDVALLLCAVLQRPRSYLYAWPEKHLQPEQQAQFDTLLARRMQGEPVAHILGEREFWSLPLKVSPASLIPRPDTECLVEQALALFAHRPPATVLDLGTGTGAIALALASEWPGSAVLGLDCVADAVALARANGTALALTHARFELSHWFSAVAADQRFELIVSNPPYIADDDPHLNEGDVRFEPASALVAEENGLADLRHIIQQAPAHLLHQGVLLLEHGYNQADAVTELLRAHGYKDVASGRDYGGRARFSWGRWPGPPQGEHFHE